MADYSEKELVEFLSGVSFFSDVSKSALKHLLEQMTVHEFPFHEVVFRSGDPGDAMYVILKGGVKVHEKTHIYTNLSAGDCFGEYALIDDELRSASITTLEPSVLLRLERNNFLELIGDDVSFAKGILSVLIKRHRELDLIQERLTVSKRDLELANSKMNSLINGALDAIVMFDDRFRIVLSNTSVQNIFENTDIDQRNILFFFDEDSAAQIEAQVAEQIKSKQKSSFLTRPVKVIGSEGGGETLNEGTLSVFQHELNTYCMLILRNINERLESKATIDLLTTQAQYLENEIEKLTSNYGIIAQDDAMLRVLEKINQVARTDATVLVRGETGTGKELVARALHNASDRSSKPLIKINCGAIPANLIESELFGHEKGAFTGAVSSRKGRFLLANQGTLFLDEIGELPIELQPKLLRVIQEGEFEAVGSSETQKVDVRIIAATHRNLLEFSKKGKFREDLYYRLNVFPIQVPPLRDRRTDIILIAEEMLRRFSEKMNTPVFPLSESDKALFESYGWPGNVRELQNLIERAVIVSDEGRINWQAIIPVNDPVEDNSMKAGARRGLSSQELLDLERENLLLALKRCSWRISGRNGAASLLKVPESTLRSRIKALGLERPV